MPSLSSVIKAERIRMTRSVHRLVPLCGVQPPVDQALPDEKPPVVQQVAAPDVSILDDLREKALEKAKETVAAAELERDRILAETDARCKEMLRRAEMNAVTIEEEAREKGREAGYLAGFGEGQREGNRLRAEAERMLDSARKIRQEMLERVEPQVVELAVRAAEKFVAGHLQSHPEAIIAIVQDALRQVRESGEIVVRLHPDDLTLCREHLADLHNEIHEHSTLHLLPDGALGQGECRVETNGAIIEFSLDERFEKLRETLAEVTSHA